MRICSGSIVSLEEINFEDVYGEHFYFSIGTYHSRTGGKTNKIILHLNSYSEPVAVEVERLFNDGSHLSATYPIKKLNIDLYPLTLIDHLAEHFKS